MIRLPSNLRSLLHTRCLVQRSYSTQALHSATAAHYDELNQLFNPVASQSKQSANKPRQGKVVVVKSAKPNKPQKKNQNQNVKPKPKPQRREKKQIEPEFPLKPDFEPAPIPKSVRLDNRDAKKQIYNYAAAVGLIPEFHLQGVQKPLRRGGVAKFVEAVIKLPEQGIEASAIQKTHWQAELVAAHEFKLQAERYKSQQADDGNELPGAEVLTTDTADQFFKYYKSCVEPNARIDFEHGTLSIKGNNDLCQARVTIDNVPIGEMVAMASKAETEKLAYLVAAVYITRGDPKLLQGFQQALKDGKGTILEPAPHIHVSVDSSTLGVMRDALDQAQRLGLPRMTEAVRSTEGQGYAYRHAKRTLTPSQLEYISKNLATDIDKFMADPKLETLRARKDALPMNQYRGEVLKMINENLYSIVVGATGSGKTTQVPQILFDDAIENGKGATCNIICTQPRRIAATSVAQRVAEERNEKLGRTVGYHVRFDRKIAEPIGSINYCTTGILLEQLKHGADGVFDSVSHLVIDEVHERDLNIDFLMIILKKAIKTRQAAGKSVPRVVLMSATLDTKLFAQYFNQSTKPGVITPCPSISVPGRTFPVKEKFLDEIMQEMQGTYRGQLDSLLARDPKCIEYLESEKVFSASNTSSSFDIGGQESVIDWKRQQPTFQDADMSGEQSLAQGSMDALVPVPLVAATLAHICNTSRNGAILAFLPGLQEITKTHEILERSSPFGINFMDTKKFKICVLHSTISKEDQADVFKPVPPGCRKIILSTNIAETSVTIPDVQYVIDSGKLREKRYDQLRRITQLQCTWVSKSSSKQRAGRAGRVQNGNYYALFTRERFEMLRAIGLPELLRSDLQETCLSIKAQSFDDSIAGFLSESIEPPAPKAVEGAVHELKAMEAFTQDEELTPLGRLLSRLPVHPTLGKMVVLGVIFRCLDPLLILGAAAEERSIFLNPPGRRKEAREAQRSFSSHQSDHITLLNAFKKLREIRDMHGTNGAWRCAEENFLHMGAFRNIDNTAKQLHDILTEVGLIPEVSYKLRENSRYGHPSLNTNSGNLALVKALLFAGHSSNLAVRKYAGGSSFRTAKENAVILHQSSINKSLEKTKSDFRSPPLLTYGTLANGDDSKSLFMRDTTMTDALSCVLFGGRLEHIGDNQFKIDGWLPFYLKAPSVMAPRIIKSFKNALDRILRSAFQSLSDLGARNRGELPEDQLREVFADNLVDILTRSAPSALMTGEGPSHRVQGPWNSQSPKQEQTNNQYTNSATGSSGLGEIFSRITQRREANSTASFSGIASKNMNTPVSQSSDPGVLWWRETDAKKTAPGAPEKVANRWVVKQLAGYAASNGGGFKTGSR